MPQDLKLIAGIPASGRHAGKESIERRNSKQKQKREIGEKLLSRKRGGTKVVNLFLILGSPEYLNSVHIWFPPKQIAAGMPGSGRHGEEERMEGRNNKQKKEVTERREKRHGKEQAAKEKGEEERETHIYMHIPGH